MSRSSSSSDELPYLVAKEPTIEAVLQLVWGRTFQRLPVVVVLIGSDRATMEALTDEGRPLYDRAREFRVKPLDPATVGEMLDLPAVDALDAYTVVGGFPVLALERRLPDDRFGGARHVGSYWNRTSTVEVDLVGGDSHPVAGTIAFVGSLKWRDGETFHRSDGVALASRRLAVPGATSQTVLVGVSRHGFDADVQLDVELAPDDIIAAYR